MMHDRSTFRQGEETTEWEDILEKQGIIKPKENPYAEADRGAEEEPQKSREEELAEKSLAEVEELEDEFDDDKFFEEYRKKRLAELKEKQISERFGSVMDITGSQYVDEVNKASESAFVILTVYRRGNRATETFCHHIATLARRHKAAKFVRIECDQMESFHKYPDAALPLVMVYKENNVKLQAMGIGSFGGPKLSAESIEWVLSKSGAIDTEIDEAPFDE